LNGRKAVRRRQGYADGRHRQRAQQIQMFALDLERLLRRRQHAQARSAGEHFAHDMRNLPGQVFAVVENQQRLARSECIHQLREGVAIDDLQAGCGGDGPGHRAGRSQRR
jgi:ATP phosphoribosyltransferase regulatory subunit HisZ